MSVNNAKRPLLVSFEISMPFSRSYSLRRGAFLGGLGSCICGANRRANNPPFLREPAEQQLSGQATAGRRRWLSQRRALEILKRWHFREFVKIFFCHTHRAWRNRHWFGPKDGLACLRWPSTQIPSGRLVAQA